MAQRFQGPFWPERFVEIIHQRTHGNPLFLTMITDNLVRQEAIWETASGWQTAEELLVIATDIPDGIRQLVVQQLSQLDEPDRMILEAASVAGIEFTAAAVAAGVESSLEAIEVCCDELAGRGQFLRELDTVTWPNGEMSGRYRFVHALYHEVVYAQLPSSRRARLHRQIGLRLEQGYGNQTSEIAAELAAHFAQGGDAQRAVTYLHTAAKTAMFRSAHAEAIAYLRQGIELLQSRPETPESRQQELSMQLMLGISLIATDGYAAPEVATVYDRALELCQDSPDKLARFQSLVGLQAYYIARADLATAWSLAQQALHIAREPGQSPKQCQAVFVVLGQVAFHRGGFVEAKRYLDQSLDLYSAWDQDQRPSIQDLDVLGLTYLAWTLGYLGYLEQARQYSEKALDQAQQVDHPFSIAYAYLCRIMTSYLRQEVAATQESADALLSLVAEYDFPYFGIWGVMSRAWSLAMQGQTQEGLHLFEEALTAHNRHGADMSRPPLLMFQAEAYCRNGQPENALGILDHVLALIEERGDRLFQATLYQMKGECLVHVSDAFTTPRKSAKSWVATVEQSFFRSLDIARNQQAKTIELQATVSLSRFWLSQGRRDEAREILTPIYDWFTEGFDTPVLQAAKALLDELACTSLS
ncbi:ATP-binding protein [Candidatus Entotheonella palauensis]|uniref:ATP-binding protein n=1 Tax=Candidatus Entotheonella palauensis TaxID=93172 RepID=UPI000B7D8D99|nr:hypothetical protein [Candidatus Entotheonella palauensis]